MILYHYTSFAALDRIRDCGEIRSLEHRLLADYGVRPSRFDWQDGLIWLTDLRSATPADLVAEWSLPAHTSQTMTQVRITVDVPKRGLVRWTEVAGDMMSAEELDRFHRGSDPSHWWTFSRGPITKWLAVDVTSTDLRAEQA